MNLLETIFIRKNPDKRVELYQGDLTALEPDEAVDLLVVSAFPNDYIPTPTSLIGALFRKGISVASLANKKAEDLRESFSCWLSQEIKSQKIELHFRRILCFEPLVRGNPPEVVGDIFRALAPILGAHTDIKSIAMPVVAAGDQGYEVTQMLEPLLEAAIHWMKHGIPLERIKIVAYSDHQAKEAHALFSKKKLDYEKLPKPPEPPAANEMQYDIFISYAREDSEHVDKLISALSRERPKVRIFLDRTDIDIGTPWQPKIFESLDNCRRVVSVFSPSYLKSKVCKEEFNIAWVRSRETDDDDILFPIFLFTANLPTYMKYRGYVDCREGDGNKLADAAKVLLNSLESLA